MQITAESKDHAINIMMSLAQLANMKLGDHLPHHLFSRLQADIDEAKSMMANLAAQHLGYTAGDTITMAASDKKFYVDGFAIPEKHVSLYVRAYPINKDGNPSVRAELLPVNGRYTKLAHNTQANTPERAH